MTGAPTPPSSDRAELLRFLRRLDRRDRIAPVLRGALVGGSLALGALLLRELLEASGLLPSPGGLLLELLAWLLPVAGAVAGYRRPDLAHAAAVGDRRGGLQDLLKTARGIEPDHLIEAPWHPLLERRAAERAAALDPSRLVPTPWRSLAGLAVVLGALVLARAIPTDPSAARLRGTLQGALDGSDAAAPEPEAGEEPGAPQAEAEPEPEPEPARLRLSPEQLAALEPGEGTSLEALAEVESGDTELGDAGEAGAAGESSAAGEAEHGANDELLQEVRRQLEEEGALPSAAEAGAGEAGEGGEQPESAGATAPADPSLEQVSDELTAIEAPTSTPSSQMSQRSAGAAAVAVPAGMEVEAGDAPREGAESGDPGAAEGGAATAPQEGFVDPLGEQVTSLDVTLELALLESRQQEAAQTTREMTPSRAAESTRRAVARAPIAPAQESVPARRPVPWTHRNLVRSYFEPTEPAAPAGQKDPP